MMVDSEAGVLRWRMLGTEPEGWCSLTFIIMGRRADRDALMMIARTGRDDVPAVSAYWPSPRTVCTALADGCRALGNRQRPPRRPPPLRQGLIDLRGTLLQPFIELLFLIADRATLSEHEPQPLIEPLFLIAAQAALAKPCQTSTLLVCQSGVSVLIQS
eukprot:920956-Rhodomonas_salina.1